MICFQWTAVLNTVPVWVTFIGYSPSETDWFGVGPLRGCRCLPGICACLESPQKCSFLCGVSSCSQHSIPQWVKCSDLLQCGSVDGLQGYLHSSAWSHFSSFCTLASQCTLVIFYTFLKYHWDATSFADSFSLRQLPASSYRPQKSLQKLNLREPSIFILCFWRKV